MPIESHYQRSLQLSWFLYAVVGSPGILARLRANDLAAREETTLIAQIMV